MYGRKGVGNIVKYLALLHRARTRLYRAIFEYPVGIDVYYLRLVKFGHFGDIVTVNVHMTVQQIFGPEPLHNAAENPEAGVGSVGAIVNFERG